MNTCEEKLRIANERIKELEENEISFPLRLALALDDILDRDNGFYQTKKLELNVFDEDFEINTAISISPRDVICIISNKQPDSKGNNRRKKQIFVKNDSDESNNNVRKFTLNNNELSFEKLCNVLDPLSHYLIVVSKSSLVNVKFYDQAQSNKLSINLTDELPISVKSIVISDSKAHRATVENFNKIKEAFNYRVSLQKKVIGYKYSMGIDE